MKFKVGGFVIGGHSLLALVDSIERFNVLVDFPEKLHIASRSATVLSTVAVVALGVGLVVGHFTYRHLQARKQLKGAA